MASRSRATGPAAAMWAVLASLGGLAVWWILSSTDPAPDRDQALEAQQRDQAETAAADAGAGLESGSDEVAERRELDPLAAQAEVEFGWKGVLRDREGAPLADVRLRWVTPWDHLQGELPHTDAQGRFVLSYPADKKWPDQGRGGISLASAPHAGLLFEVPPPAIPPTEVELVVRAEPASLPVRVVEVDGVTPRVGLPLMLSGHQCFDFGHTDEEGRVLLQGIAGESLDLNVDSEIFGWVVAPMPLILDAGRNPELTIQYQGTPTAATFVAHDHDSGRRLSEARWYLLDGEGGVSAEALTAPQGRLHWTLHEHGVVTSYCGLRVEAPGFLPTHVEWTQQAPKGEISVPLEPRAVRPIQLELSRGGTPMAETQVRLGAHGPFFRSDDLSSTGEGKFGIGPFSGLEIEAEGTTNALGVVVFDFPWPEGEDLPDRVHLRVAEFDLWLTPTRLDTLPWRLDFAPPTATLVFEFRDEQGQPLAGQELELWYETTGPQAPLVHAARTPPYRMVRTSTAFWAPADHQGRTGQSGTLEFEVPAGIDLSWCRPVEYPRDRTPQRVPALEPGARRVVTIQPEALGKISGRILRDDRAEWDGGSIVLQLQDEQGVPIRDADGSTPSWSYTWTSYGSALFEFKNVPQGRYQLGVEGVRAAEEVVWVETGESGVELLLEKLCRLHLTVRDASTGALLQGEANAQVEGGVSSANWSRVWNGRGSLEFPTGQALRLAVEAESYRGKFIELGDVPLPGTELTREIELEPGRTVELLIKPEAAVEDGRFAGVILRQADGSPFKNLPITYRTHPGAVFLLGMPREAFLVDFPARGTREVMFTVLVPAAEAAAPGAAADLSRVQVDWPED